jgi:DNA-binding MarR family transcriptional regulator
MAAASATSFPEQYARPREVVGEARTVQALLALERPYLRLWRMLEEQIAEDRVPLSRSEIRLLQGIPLESGALAADLARDLGIDPGQLSRVLNGLVRRRLLARLRSEPDARRKRVVVSERGRLALAALDRAAFRIGERMLGALSLAERRRLAEAAETIGNALAGRPNGCAQR